MGFEDLPAAAAFDRTRIPASGTDFFSLVVSFDPAEWIPLGIFLSAVHEFHEPLHRFRDQSHRPLRGKHGRKFFLHFSFPGLRKTCGHVLFIHGVHHPGRVLYDLCLYFLPERIP